MRPKDGPLAAVQAVILDALRERWGPDNASPFEDEPELIGVILPSGAFVNVRLSLMAEKGAHYMGGGLTL